MKEQVMMACGHAANATGPEGNLCCAICIGIDDRAEIVAEKPSLEGRKAQCSYCKKEVDSSWNLAFFEYKGANSPSATERCGKCGYYKKAHVNHQRGHKFVPHGPFEYDDYYCGCRGWN